MIIVRVCCEHGGGSSQVLGILRAAVSCEHGGGASQELYILRAEPAPASMVVVLLQVLGILGGALPHPTGGAQLRPYGPSFQVFIHHIIPPL